MKLITLPSTERMILLAAILLIVIVFRASQFFATRSKSILEPGTHRDYGLSGGSICPKCHRPIRLAFFSIKLGIGTKLTRCEFCGKWSVVRRLSLEELRAAENAELADSRPAQPVHTQTDAEKLREQTDQSQYIDRV